MPNHARMSQSMVLLSVGLTVAVPAVAVVLALLMLAGRNDPDPDGRRPDAVYLFTVSFVALALTVIAASAAAGAVARVVLQPMPRHSDSAFFATTTSADVEDEFAARHNDGIRRATNDALRAMLAGVPAVWVLWFHRRRIHDLLADPGRSRLLVERLHRTFERTVCFAGVVCAMFAVPLALWGALRWGLPGTTAPDGVDEASHGLVQLAANGVLAMGAAVAARLHWPGADAPAGEDAHAGAA